MGGAHHIAHDLIVYSMMRAGLCKPWWMSAVTITVLR